MKAFVGPIGLGFLALAATIAGARAENPITAPTRNSQFGIQSIVTQKRDSLQQHEWDDQKYWKQRAHQKKRNQPSSKSSND